MKFEKLVLSALILLATSTAQAQQSVTFAQVLQSALDSHPMVLGKRSAQAGARADQKGAEWLRYPTPVIEAARQGTGRKSGLVRIEQPLWSNGRITAAIDAADSRLNSADAAVEEAKRDLSLKVIAAYTEALRQEAKQQYAKRGVEEHEKLLAMIDRRVESEVSSLADKHMADSRLHLAVNELSLTNQVFKNSLAQLSQLNGNPVVAISKQGLSELEGPVSLDAAVTLELSYSPTLRRLAADEDVANADIDSKRSAYLPSLSFRLEKDLGDPFEGRAMVVLQAQPGAGLSSMAGVDAALSRREAAHLARLAAERDIRDSVTLDWNEWEAARLRLDNASQTSALSNEVFESYARQYVIGRKSWLEVLNAVRESTQSQFAVADARAQALAASLRLRARTGTLYMDEGTTP